MYATIALDARTIFVPARRGTGKNLLDLYRVIARRRPQWRFILYHRGQSDGNLFAHHRNVLSRVIDMPGDRFRLWEHIRLPLAARWDDVDVLHCPASSCPRRSKVPVVSTVHDLVPLKISDAQNGQARRFRSRIQRCLSTSQRVITVSEHTRRDLISEFAADPERIDVIRWAPDSAYAPVRDQARLAATKSRYNIRGRYLLAFSGRSPRKNAQGMIRGFARLDEALRRGLQFVVIGVEPSAQRRRLQQFIHGLGLNGQVQVFGFAPEADIAPLLSGAEGLAFCSLYEGFGLPILDAYRCETAVLTSAVSSMPEVAGDAALYCDPTNPDSISAGMRRLVLDEALRRELVHRGRQRVQEFTWEQSAEAVCTILEKCL